MTNERYPIVRPVYEVGAGFSQDPLAILASQNPTLAKSVFDGYQSLERRRLDLQERGMKYQRDIAMMHTVTSVVDRNSDQICTWLQNRNVGESWAEAKVDAKISTGGFFFGHSVRVQVKSTFRCG
ncbi:MAG: hypothetical protein KKF56_01055 [Nanoarchaeota archaeon]|nr:hypothetical protein [Nanoarchaeota archaeon]